jgi:hypothetical protein
MEQEERANKIRSNTIKQFGKAIEEYIAWAKNRGISP